MKNNYIVYVHVFPNGKRYIGCTCRPPKARWNGGLGYEHQKDLFAAIVKYGWNNIRHYILIDNLTRDEALLYESAFIYGWKTYTKSYGYNAIANKIDGMDEINIPSFRSCKKIKVQDDYDETVLDRRNRRDLNRVDTTRHVKCLESGEIFKSAYDAATICGNGSERAIYQAILNGHASGTCYIRDEETGLNREVPAHWEYTN